MKVKTAALWAAIVLTGCSTQAQQSCQAGQPLTGRSLADTCAQAQADSARHTSQVVTGAAVAVVALAVTAAVVSGSTYQAPRQYTTVVVNNSTNAATRTSTGTVHESQQDLLTPTWGWKE
jgi:hypothetical protein